MPKLHYHAPECYEMRLHDQDGQPDEDFPALERTRKIRYFADDDATYCLCQIMEKEGCCEFSFSFVIFLYLRDIFFGSVPATEVK